MKNNNKDYTDNNTAFPFGQIKPEYRMGSKDGKINFSGIKKDEKFSRTSDLGKIEMP